MATVSMATSLSNNNKQKLNVFTLPHNPQYRWATFKSAVLLLFGWPIPIPTFVHQAFTWLPWKHEISAKMLFFSLFYVCH
jgi:hypothetical protein